jgi:hypothetical protein
MGKTNHKNGFLDLLYIPIKITAVSGLDICPVPSGDSIDSDTWELWLYGGKVVRGPQRHGLSSQLRARTKIHNASLYPINCPA